MPDFTVDGDTRLDRFLRKNRVQQWRIPILVAKGGVVVKRGGVKLKLKDETARLEAGDKVTLVMPVPAACAKALQQEATDNWRDYAVAPGDTDFDKRLKKFVTARERTIVLQSPLLFTFKGWLEGLATSDEITSPIRHLVFVGHGGLSGVLKAAIEQLPLDAITYEMLEDAVKKKTLVVDTDLFLPRPVEGGKTYPPELRILGCLIGASAPFMKKLSEAFGRKLRIYAPKHLMVGASVGNPPGEAAYVAYAFNVFVPAKVGTKSELVDLLVKRNTKYVLENGKEVPKQYWKTWVPDDPNANFNGLKIREFRNPVVFPVLGSRDNAPRRFGAADLHFWKGGYQIKLDKDTGKEADRKKAVKAALLKRPDFQDTHPFPWYVRMGYKTMDEFMEGWTWNFSYDKKAKILSFDPVRIEYRMLQPIINEAKKTLVINYYPYRPDKVPKRFKGRLPVIQLNVGDPFYFGWA
jgi:hypothetical protein